MVKKKTWKETLSDKMPRFTWWQITLLVAIVLLLLSGGTIGYKGCVIKKDPVVQSDLELPGGKK